MSADPIIYCLEQLTDYAQFERLASDLMARAGFSEIEPLGGTGDGGRDALHVSRTDGKVHVFAYSVRSDWETKLRHDSARLHEKGIDADVVVYVTTQLLSTSKKDSMRSEICEKYAWDIEYFDVERIRVMLTDTSSDLLEIHPSIFCSPWFRRSGGVLTSNSARDIVVIDHVDSDRALASWLFRKLSLTGYNTWCSSFAPLAGENVDDSIRTLIQTRAACYLPVLSDASVSDPTFRSRWPLALLTEDSTIPCWAVSLDAQSLDSQMQSLAPLRFDQSWQLAISELLEILRQRGIPQNVQEERRLQLALAAYSPKPLIMDQPETVYANVFRVEVPHALLAYQLSDDSVKLNRSLELTWAFVRRGSTLFSFTPPPDEFSLNLGTPHQYAWRVVPVQYEQNSVNLVKELVRKSVETACYDADFLWCEDRKTFYLGEDEQQRHTFQHVDGRWTHSSLTGSRAFGWGESQTRFNYQVGPRFRVGVDDRGQTWLTVRLYVRLTDDSGVPLDTRKIPSRRKTVTKSWWNKQWLARLLAIMQRIANTGTGLQSEIHVGDTKHLVSVTTSPLEWVCPVSIDVQTLDNLGSIQEELASLREWVAEEIESSG